MSFEYDCNVCGLTDTTGPGGPETMVCDRCEGDEDWEATGIDSPEDGMRVKGKYFEGVICDSDGAKVLVEIDEEYTDMRRAPKYISVSEEFLTRIER